MTQQFLFFSPFPFWAFDLAINHVKVSNFTCYSGRLTSILYTDFLKDVLHFIEICPGFNKEVLQRNPFAAVSWNIIISSYRSLYFHGMRMFANLQSLCAGRFICINTDIICMGWIKSGMKFIEFECGSEKRLYEKQEIG